MKLTALLFALVATAFTFSAEASSRTRLPVSQVTNETVAVALETYRGRQFEVRDVALPRTRHTQTLLNSHQIEFNSGAIIYPQEVEFVIIEGRPPREIERPAPRLLKRAPREEY
jgi:hypothetical protein